jgi:hypothetical protein
MLSDINALEQFPRQIARGLGPGGVDGQGNKAPQAIRAVALVGLFSFRTERHPENRTTAERN